MKNVTKHIAVFIAAFALFFTSLPVTADAVSAPAKVKNFKAAPKSETSVRLTWKKPGKCTGYAVYVNGKLNKRLSVRNTAYIVSKLKPGKTYKFVIRSYNTYRKKQYYNFRTRKWQTKKPAKKYWKKCPSGKYKGRKTRIATAYKYSKASAIRTAKTKAVTIPSAPDVPATPSNLIAFETTADSIRIRWDKNSSNTAGYEVYINGNMMADVGPGRNFYSFRKLSENTSYQIKVRAYIFDSDTARYSNAATLTAATTVKNAVINGGVINTATPPPTLPSGKNTTGGVFDQNPNVDYSAGSLKRKAVEWAEANIPNDASDGEKAHLILKSVYDNFSGDIPEDGECVVAAMIAMYMFDYVGIENAAFNLYASNGAKWGLSMHVCNLIWIKGKPYAVDAKAATNTAFEYANTNTYESNENINYDSGGCTYKTFKLSEL